MRPLMATFLAVAVLSSFSSHASAQGSQSALSLERDYVARLQESLHKLQRPDSLIAKETSQFRETREPVKEVPRSAADLIGEANLALLGGSSVKPGVMTTARYKRNDFLIFGAQFLFGDTGGDSSTESVAGRLFVPEASKYALNLLGTWKPRSRGEFWRSIAVNFGFYYAQKELPVESDSVSTDTGVINAHVGVEGIVVPERFSIYVNVSYLTNQQNVAEYQSFFGAGAPDDFWYVAPGVRARFSDKLFVDMELICLTNEMKSLSGVEDGVLPLFRIGFTQGLTSFGLD